VSEYAPIVVVAFIHPDFEQLRVQLFSHQLQTPLMPPVPLSARQVHDGSQPLGGFGLTVAVNVTSCGP